MSGAPDVFQPVLGWRRWTFREPNELVSINQHAPWPGGESMQAECNPAGGGSKANSHGHEVAGVGCTCGWYAYHNMEDVPGEGEMAGAIVGWGNLAAHPTGFRAEYCKVVVLIPLGGLPNPAENAEALYRRYGAPVVLDIQRAEHMALKAGQPLDLSMRPDDGSKPLPGGHPAGDGGLRAAGEAMQMQVAEMRRQIKEMGASLEDFADDPAKAERMAARLVTQARQKQEQQAAESGKVGNSGKLDVSL